MTFKENLETLQPINSIDKIILTDGNGDTVGEIPNADGKRGSLQVYANLLNFNDGEIYPGQAAKGLTLFGEYKTEAMADTSSHPNIQRLFAVEDGMELNAQIIYNANAIKQDIYKIGEMKANEETIMNNPFVQRSVKGLISLLESGTVRAAEKRDGVWSANAWVKQGILYGFGGCGVVPMEFGATFMDKELFPPRDLSKIEGVRVVPGGSSIRGGAYFAPGVIVMPPAYANVGAFVDEGTMLDSHALAGSCAQIGKDCHISAGAQIGGVLEPANATPCVVENHAFMGINSSIAEGTVLGEYAVLAPGVNLTSSSPIYDRTTSQYIKKIDGKTIIPTGAVLVPGSRNVGNGIGMNIAVIAKYRDEKTSTGLALEDALRV